MRDVWAHTYKPENIAAYKKIFKSPTKGCQSQDMFFFVGLNPDLKMNL